MREKRVALVSFDVPEAGSMNSFSYSVHKLRASLVSCEALQDVAVEVIHLQSNDVEDFLERLEAFRPTLIGCTLYVWSLIPFRELARRHKAMHPEVPIVVGGPSARKSVFDLAPYREFQDTVDAAVTGEGEELIRRLAFHHLEDDWRTKVTGLLLPRGGTWVSNGDAPRLAADDYPSPYHIGMVPAGLTGFIETFRGCPIKCSFCQWGALPPGGIHSVDYLARHLEGIKNADVKNVFFLDAAFNLNSRAFRNLVQAEREVRALRDTVVFGHLYPTFVKDIHLEFFELLGRVHPAVGVQSFDPEVLERIGRPFDVERFTRVLDALRGRFGIDVELMLGLPGDSPASFRETLHRAIEVADAIRVSFCMVLPDALLDRARPSDGLDFDPETFVLRSCAGWTPEELEREWRYVHEVAEQHYQQEITDGIVGFQVHEFSRIVDARSPSNTIERTHELDGLDAGAIERLRTTVATKPELGFDLRTVHLRERELLIHLDGPRGEVVLEAIPAIDGARYLVRYDGIDYSHRGAMGREEAEALKRLIPIVHPGVRELLIPPGEPRSELVQVGLRRPA